MTSTFTILTESCAVIATVASILVLIFLSKSAGSYCVSYTVAIIASGVILTVAVRIALISIILEITAIIVAFVALVTTLVIFPILVCPFFLFALRYNMI